MKKISTITILFLGLFGLFCSEVMAHYPWINMSNYCPDTGESPQLTIGWGHSYPLGGFLKMEDLEGLEMIGPDGKKIPLTAKSVLEFETETSLGSPGAYIVTAQRKTGFYTKTTQGGKRQSKEGLTNVLTCSLSHMSMKSVVTVGDAAGTADRTMGQPLEIVPLANPAKLKAGDYLPLRILLHGKPYQGMVHATYMGFSTEKEVFAYTSKTDRQGKGRIRILQPGIWLLKAEHREPYPDQDVCDVESFVATLTVEVQ